MKAHYKSLFLFFFCLFAFQWANGQSEENYIRKTDGTEIKIDSIFSYGEINVEYVSRGNVHDVPKKDVKYIVLWGKNIHFNEDGEIVKSKEVSVRKDTLSTNNKVTVNDVKPDYQKKQLQFFPLSLLEPETGIRFGMELPLNEHWSFNPGFNILVYYNSANRAFVSSSSSFKSYSGYAGYLDLKYYAFTGDRVRFYLGPSFMYKQRYIVADESTTLQGPAERHMVTSTITTYNLKLGLATHLNNKFVFDFYTGIGMRVKDVVNRTVNSTTISDEDYIGIPEKILPNFLMGFSVGYKF